MMVMKMERIYIKPEILIVKAMMESIMVKPSKPEEGHNDDPLSKEATSFDESEDPLFEANQKNLWEE